MSDSGSILLVRASGFGPLPSVFEQRAGEQALWRVFEKAGLPVDVIGAPHTPVPLPAMISLFERCKSCAEVGLLVIAYKQQQH